MSLSIELLMTDPSTQPIRLGGKPPNRSEGSSTVVIVGPPWPRSGAAWVIKNQIDHYRARGFNAVLVIVPFHRWFMRENPVWEEIEEGFKDLGAQGLFWAPLDNHQYTVAKYVASISHVFHGTVLHWESAMAKSARLPAGLIESLQSLPVALLHVNYVQTLGFALRLRSELRVQNPRIPIILETHDVQSHLLLEDAS